MGKILLVDDEKNILKVISALLTEGGHVVFPFERAEDGLRFLEGNPVDVIITDKKMPGMDGLEFLLKVRANGIFSPFMVITAFGSISDAISAIKMGADHYLTKPIDDRELIEKIEYLIDRDNISIEKDAAAFEGMVGQSTAMRDIYRTINLVAKSSSSVLITGESGTGKELIARSIHTLSDRRKQPFVAINCSAIPENLFENELFGHEKGAFTGAHQRNPGRIELAGGGTLFFDEISEVSMQSQAKLLRVLQEREFMRLGGTDIVRAVCRFIFATNKNLEDMVSDGRFREDLFYRVNVIPVDVPPLRERREDIRSLAKHFLKKYTSENNKVINDIEEDALNAFIQYHWPGNIRELENTIERAVVLCDGSRITKNNLPKRLLVRSVEQSVKQKGSGIITDFEKKMIIEALELNRWNQTKAAEFLGISRKQLRTKMKNYSLFA